MFIRSFVVILLALLASPGMAAKRWTVDQLKHEMETLAAKHRSDDQVAAELADIELTSRLSGASLSDLLNAHSGTQTAQALHLLADQSEFLEQDPAMQPRRSVPDFAAQKFMLNQTVHYVARTLRALPDFLATRQTIHYDDLPHADGSGVGGWPKRDGMRERVRFESPIAYRDGRETDAPGATKASKTNSPNVGLNSWGEFGPILEIVLVDAAKGKLSWSHWEMIVGKPAAVFQFQVGESASHYEVQFEGQDIGEQQVGNRADRRRQGTSLVSQIDAGTKHLQKYVAYRGFLTIDPETGTVLRLTIEAVLPANSPIQRAAIMVEYGTVTIGADERVLPVRSITVSQAGALYSSTPTGALGHIDVTQINEVQFTRYRHFGSEVKLLMSSVDEPPAVQSGSSGESPEAAAPSAESPATTTPATIASADAEPAVAPARAAVPAAPPVADEEVLLHDVNGMPGMGDPANSVTGSDLTGAKGPQADFTLNVTTRLVDLGLVAVDKKGKPITDLKPEEIEVYDNGRRQQVAAFHHNTVAADGAKEESQPAPQSDTFTNTLPANRSIDEVPDLLILLLDESHLPFFDINRARFEVLQFLKATRPTSRVALYSIEEHGFHVIQAVTTDHALVEAKLAAWVPDAGAIAQARALDTRNRQQFDEVRNPSDLNSVNGNLADVPDGMTTVDPQLRKLGDNPLSFALSSMIALAHHFSSVPGHKSLAWISGDSALVNWDDQAVGIEKNFADFTPVINRAIEALNEAHIALYAVDASIQSVGGAAVDPSLYSANVVLNPVAAANSAPGGGGNRNTTDGRITQQMQSDTRTIQGPVRKLADATGGRAVNKGADLKKTLDSIESDADALYEVGFHPEGGADNKFHSLEVKIPSRKDVKLRYRSSYEYTEESDTPKSQLQKAVWSPEDATGIPLTAEAVPSEDATTGLSTVKLRITFAALDLEQKSDRWADDLYVFTAQRNETAQKAEVSGETLRLSLKPETYETGMPAGIPYQVAVDIKPKFGSVRVIVIDGNSGKVGSVTVPASALSK